MELSPAVQKLIAIRTKLEEERHQFAIKHGFAFKRAQNFKDCVVIRWKTSTKKHEINHPRIEEYVKISHELSDKYNLCFFRPLLDYVFRLTRNDHITSDLRHHELMMAHATGAVAADKDPNTVFEERGWEP